MGLRYRRWLGCLMIGLSVWVAHTGAAAWQVSSLFSHPSELKAATLPVQAQEVLAQIHSGGPFRFEKDGTVFANRERLLPRQTRGFYREYTVPTPGLRHRGARRIVCGGWQLQRPEACYYSADHYAKFHMIDR